MVNIPPIYGEIGGCYVYYCFDRIKYNYIILHM